MNIFNLLKTEIVNVGEKITKNLELLKTANIEIPKNTLNGDLSTNIAMIIAAKENKNPREIALEFKKLLSSIPFIAHIEIAGSGFINFTIKASEWQKSICSILDDTENFSESEIGKDIKVNIEYVSANPTGPMHIGHARGAVYGDALALLLKKCGYQVTKEYYINDAGSQIDDLTKTVFLRYKEALGEEVTIPSGLYPGKYLIPVGQALATIYGDDLLTMPLVQSHQIIKEFAVKQMLDIIKNDLKNLGIEHDFFFSEQSLHSSNKIEQVVEILKANEMIYEGVLPPPKGKIDNDWIEKKQMLFRSSNFGDDQDRPIQKSDGSWSYLAADFAYAKDKIDRGYNNLIYILGADHSGYVKRIEAVINSLSQNKVKTDIKICQLVNFVEDGIPIKMSKRSGNFTTVEDVTNEVGKDIIRFMMLTRKNDAVLDFDLAKVKELSKENPVFYVQYAHVRTISILTNCEENAPLAYKIFLDKKYDLSLLSSEEEIQLIKLLASWPKLIEGAAKSFEPHRIAFYLQSVAARFHSLWNLGRENNDYRFIIEDDIELTAARLALAKAINKIIVSGFEIIGITPLDKM